tara:strand:+ start:571 stop:993 length:423 start_codon:yes stop_codon:yes gene_type:complete
MLVILLIAINALLIFKRRDLIKKNPSIFIGSNGTVIGLFNIKAGLEKGYLLNEAIESSLLYLYIGSTFLLIGIIFKKSISLKLRIIFSVVWFCAWLGVHLYLISPSEFFDLSKERQIFIIAFHFQAILWFIISKLAPRDS